MTTQVSSNMISFETGATGFRNKIINGCGWIDQRNNNASVTVNSAANTFGPDRWAGFGQSTDGVFSLTGTKSTYDVNGKGMPSSIYIQTTTADSSIGAAQTYGIRYIIEGQDVAAWRIGTAQAATVTLSFRAYSTKTGTHCVALQNAASDRSYVATYTINQASTWEYKTITIALDTTGTWLTTNGQGLKLFWNIGAGSTYQAAAANTWSAGQYYSVTGAQNVIDTLNAVLAITDVQLELGANPTPFENRPLAVELALCQRYYETGNQPYLYMNFGATGLTTAYGDVRYAVTKRAAPTTVTASSWQYYSSGTGTAFTPTLANTVTDRFTFQGSALTNWNGWAGTGTWKADAEL